MTRTEALPPGSRILVTGANGYICSHVIDTLLRMGYTIRGTVREAKPWLDELFQREFGKERFETVVVPGVEHADAFQGVMDGVSGIVHVVRTAAEWTGGRSMILTPGLGFRFVVGHRRERDTPCGGRRREYPGGSVQGWLRPTGRSDVVGHRGQHSAPECRRDYS